MEKIYKSLRTIFSKVPRSPKKEGSILMVAVFLSGLILTIGINASKLLMKEVSFSADFVQAERAYFAAESGIEKALLELNEQPVQNVEGQTIPIGEKSAVELTIVNEVDRFAFALPPLGNQKFRLTHDTDPSLEESIAFMNDLSLNVQPQEGISNKFLWKVLCQSRAEINTISIQKIVEDNGEVNISNLFASPGTDNQNQERSLNSVQSEIAPHSCFFSVQNLLPRTTLDFVFTGTNITPHKATIVAKGQSGKQEKHIVFEYAQKNIGSLFDFTFLHTEQGIR